QYVRRNYNVGKLQIVKLGFASKLMCHNPALPVLAVLGVLRLTSSFHVVERDRTVIVIAYGIGALASMLQQGNRVWYYLLPLLPPMALLATLALTWVSDTLGVAIGASLAIAALLGSVSRNLWHVLARERLDAVRRAFAVYNRRGRAFGDEFARGNLAVERACETMRSRIAGSSVLVLGRYNQASVLLEAGYDTPISSVCELAESVAGDLHAWLPSSTDALPDFLIDTDNEYAARTVQFAWMADYRLADESGSIRLYVRNG
ncbi:MAG TPA: hypothetical protein VHZ95_10255, partial [Polyangiales bacterium]|nr:hypothetical protein [Polyangiales bacterium]